MGDGAVIAPLGGWSLVATVLVGARGMPDTVAGCNYPAPRDIPGRSAADPRDRRWTAAASGALGVVDAAFADRVAVALGE